MMKKEMQKVEMVGDGKALKSGSSERGFVEEGEDGDAGSTHRNGLVSTEPRTFGDRDKV